jgi:hypothetical protein
MQSQAMPLGTDKKVQALGSILLARPTMTGPPKRMKYRGVEFDIHQIAEKRWNWHIYPRMQISIHRMI